MKYESPPYPPQLAAETNSGKPGERVTRRRFGIATLSATAGLLLPGNSYSLAPEPTPLPTPAMANNIVLVHGAFADGSSWSRVIPLLEAKGFNVTAVQNPLTSLAEDVATTRRLLAQQTGPTILVGHSYAGFVITEAGNAPNVVGLVYISSYGPAEGESHDDLVKRFAAPRGLSAVRLDENGYLWITREKYHEAFAQDVDLPQAAIMAAVQKPVSKKNCFGAPVSAPAWKSKPSWFLLSTDDHMINPELQRFMAKRMGATVASVPSSHASLVSHPVETANLIAEAATRKA
jgi:pimeloyl-ACP methyl ester carboxylesterase